jgi:hypothetical protein
MGIFATVLPVMLKFVLITGVGSLSSADSNLPLPVSCVRAGRIR